MRKEANIFVAGHDGLAGSAIVRRLTREGYRSLLRRTSFELDLRNPRAVADFFQRNRIDYVFLSSGDEGGSFSDGLNPADQIRDNLLIQTNVIDAAYRFGVKKLLFLASECVYPKTAPEPVKEEALMTGPLEPADEARAIAKIAGIRMCQAYNRQYGARFIAAVPASLYGPNDEFEVGRSGVLQSFIRRFHEAKVRQDPWVTMHGTGLPRREYLHADDMADACLFLMNRYEESDIINIGAGQNGSVAELAFEVSQAVGYGGDIRFDTSKPDMATRKRLDASKLESLGWQPQIPLKDGLAGTYEWFSQHYAHATVSR
ncbi:GDP-L-fucose synthase [Cohnella pontilimi]|uniref:GDP-L-fucose synthase n=1 Tax=Cohnella pontilimi TaxID=2564100 RepID=A0A4U0FF11_9BACL|nr:GDP-L-fucose synthase [Cohnella pontilimi]TJY42944.1 GDP-L-fucose synthase [Cohnella pontilimi]